MSTPPDSNAAEPDAPPPPAPERTEQQQPAPDDWSWWPHSKGGRVAAVILLAALVVGGYFELASTNRVLKDPDTPSACHGLIGTRSLYTPRQADKKSELSAYTLAPQVPDQVYQLAFGANRQPDYFTAEFRETGGQRDRQQVDRTVLHTEVSDFQRVDGRKFHNPKDQIYAQAIVGRRGAVHLRVCFDPGSGRRIVPGTYVGTVSIDDDTLKAPTVASAQVTLKYPDLVGPMVLIVVAVVAAAAVKALADQDTYNLPHWLRQRKNVLALQYGVVAVALVYATFLRSPDWGTNGLLDLGALFAAAFSAFLAGVTAHQAAGEKLSRRAARKKQQEEPGAGKPGEPGP
jgi:hypothetical protein